MRKRVARLPVVVIVRVLHQLVPDRYLAFEILLVCIRQRSEVEKKAITVGRRMIESRHVLSRRFRPRAPEAGKKVECVREKERAVVMEIVADKPVGDRRLR